MAMANPNSCPCRSVFPRRPSSTLSRMAYQRGSLLPSFPSYRRLRISEVRCIQNANDPKRKATKRDILQSDAVGSAFKAEEIEGDGGTDKLVSRADAIVPAVEVVEEKEGIDWKWPPWETHIPMRYRIIGASSLAFVICNMDKVNLSIAIIPMSNQFGWNASTAGLVQSSFFWGYALSQLPGGWLAKIFGGRKVLGVGVLVWSLATAFVPLVGGFMPGLVFSRILVGIGEGVSPSAATDLIAKSIPPKERSRAVAFVFGGLSVGSALGLILAPSIIQSFGWESVFYIFGIVGILWCFGFDLIQGDSLIGKTDIFGLKNDSSKSAGSVSSVTKVHQEKTENMSLNELGVSLKDVPWSEILKSPAVRAMVYAHFCGSWGHFTCLSWLPTYFCEELKLNLTEAAWVSVLPPIGAILITSVTAQFADSLLSKGYNTTSVRKICQTIAFLSPAFFMALSSLDLDLPAWEIVVFLSSGLALSNFSLSGLYCTHQDISPEYASILLGITSTAGAVPGIVGVALTGYLLDLTHSWSMSLFFPSIFFYLTGSVVWITFASSDPQSFSKESTD